MKRYRVFLFVATLCLSPVQLTLAQTSGEPASALPRLVRFGGTVEGPQRQPTDRRGGHYLCSLLRTNRWRAALDGDAERHRR
jgi:hypothetical protein